MDSLATENLFLLEFLVDDVKLEERCTCDTPPGEHCVSFQFLDNDPLDVCEADFSGGDQGKDDSIKSGKSCLFSLTPEQVQQAMQMFDVTVSLFKKMQPGWLPDKICIGTALISITNLFVELVESVEAQSEQTPTAKTLKDTFDVTDNTGSKMGKVSIYIRMSCFGKLIVTQFQMNLEDKSVLFKDKGGQSLYRYKKAGRMGNENTPPGYLNPPGTPTEGPCSQCYEQPGGQMGFGQPPGMGGFDQQQFMPPPNMQCPMQPCFPDQFGGMGGGMGGMPGMPGMPGDMSMMFNSPPNPYNDMMMSPYGGQGADQFMTPCEECGTLLQPRFDEDTCAPCCQPPDPPGNYQEIGASMGGNSLTIRVHKDRNKVEQVFGDNDNGGGGGSCSCCMGDSGGKQKKQTSCTPNNQTLEISPGINQGGQDLPFSLKMGGAGGCCSPKNNIIVNPGVCTKPDGTKCVEISDPNKETFVLRIGKKSEGLQKKANLELELCTPRGPELKPIPKKETREIQYDSNDVTSTGKKCKGGKKDKKKKK